MSSLRGRLNLVVLGTSLAAVMTTCVAFAAYEYVSFRRDIVRNLELRAAIIAANSTAALAFRNPADATSVLSALAADPHVVAAALYDARGHLFANYPATGTPPTELPADGTRFERGFAVTALPVRHEGRALGTVWIRSDLDELTARWRAYIFLVTAIAAAAMLLAGALATNLGRRFSEPMLALAATARDVSERKDYSLRAPPGGEGEIAVLTTDFNAMLDEIRTRDRELHADREEIQRLNAELEQRVKQRTAELEVVNRELEAFAYSVSHDLRAPLRAIDGFSKEILDSYAAVLDDVGRQHLRRVRAAAVRMAELIDDLLRLSRVSRGEIRRRHVDLTALAEDVAEELRRAHPARDVTLRIQPGMAVDADPALVRVVLDNLLGNAWKYTALRAQAHIDIGTEEAADATTFVVKDDGAGFDMTYADKLFAVFQRLHRSDEFEGSGVGLATVQRIVHRHGGQIWAEAEVGRGATFYFTLEETAKPASQHGVSATREENATR